MRPSSSWCSRGPKARQRSAHLSLRGSASAVGLEDRGVVIKTRSSASWTRASEPRRWRILCILAGSASLFVGAVFAISASAATADLLASWPSAGQNIANSRTQPLEFTINPRNVGQLAPKWVFTTHGDVSATPTVADGAVYFPDFGGYVNAVNATTGQSIWQNQVSSYGDPAGAVSRTSPLVYGNELIFGDNFNRNQSTGAHVFAVSRNDGQLLWSTQVDSNQAAQVTANPVIANGKLIIGVASNEEADAANPAYACCTFRGSVVALDPATGHTLWKTYTVPANSGPCAGSNPTTGPYGCGYTGGAVWDTPAIDPLSGTVFVGTGNNYTTPDSANACQQAAQTNKTSDANCTDPQDYFDSVLALNLRDGHIIWGDKIQGWDAWNVACAFEPLGVTWCPSIYSPDYDFGGAGPNLMVVKGPNGLPRELVGVGQKSGVYWAFDPRNGSVVWNTLVGPGSSLGGIEWGTAYDLQRVYVPIANAFGTSYQLANGGATVTGGSWAALDPQTGKFDWQVATPGTAPALGGASEANGVVYAGTMAAGPTDNNMFALDASTGKTLWSFASGGSVNAAPAIANGTVYWGSGYSHLGIPGFTGNNKFYAFTINGH